jgi:hypothetical protein
MIGSTFCIPVLFIVIGLFLLFCNKENKHSGYYILGDILICVFSILLIVSIVMVPVNRMHTAAWMEKYDAGRVVLIELRKKGDPLELIGFGAKMAELNGKLMEKKYYATCMGGMFAPYYPDSVLIVRPMKP